MRKLLFATVAAAPMVLALTGTGACGGSVPPETSHAGDAATGGSRIDGPLSVAGPCEITIDAPAYQPAVHVGFGSHVEYDSNPPSSGPHYPVWAAFQTWTTPVKREYYVHDMEHGAVVLLAKCEGDASCADLLAGLGAVRDALPTDPLCDPSIRVRAVITQDPLLDVPFAAAAWGWTYKARCLDLPSLTQFAKDHYGKGPEPICANGSTSL